MKKCKDCGKTRNHNNSLISRCKECTYNRSIANPKQNTLQAQKPMKKTRLKQVSSKNKNTIAKFTQKTKEKIYERQNGACIISGDPIEEYHHSFYGALNANFGEDRNSHYEGTGLSAKVHYIIHHGKDAKLIKSYRAKCVEYSTRMRLEYKVNNILT